MKQDFVERLYRQLWDRTMWGIHLPTHLLPHWVRGVSQPWGDYTKVTKTPLRRCTVDKISLMWCHSVTIAENRWGLQGTVTYTQLCETTQWGNRLANYHLCSLRENGWKSLQDLGEKCHILASVEQQFGETFFQLTSHITVTSLKTYARLTGKVPASQLFEKPMHDLQGKRHTRNSVKLGSGGTIVHLKCTFTNSGVLNTTCRT